MRTQIIYEDAHILVCYKPSGLATQTSKVGQPDMVSELKNYLAGQSRRERRDIGPAAGQPYLGIIHRLDQPVEGLLVFARDNPSAAALTAALSRGTLNKQYYAVVCGQPEAESAELVDYLVRDPATGSAVVTEDAVTGKRAVLRYQVMGQISTPTPMALLDIHIDTGRFHQIRAQMAHAGLPLLGDSRYASPDSMQVSRQLQVQNVALCASHIRFPHPVTGQLMEFQEKPKGHIFSQFL